MTVFLIILGIIVVTLAVTVFSLIRTAKEINDIFDSNYEI